MARLAKAGTTVGWHVLDGQWSLLVGLAAGAYASTADFPKPELTR